MLTQVTQMTLNSSEFKPLNESIQRIFNIVLEFRELHKKMSKIDFEDDNMREQVEQIESEYKKLKVIQGEHMKFIIGVLSKRAQTIGFTDHLKDAFNRLDFNSYYSSQ